ncbi:MAG: hypothetical protein WCP89_02345, partial [archaeon]
MKRDKRGRKGVSKLLIFLAGAILILSFIGFAIALSDDERTTLQGELNSLESDLSLGGYNWLVNYSVSYPSVQVFRENSNESLATFQDVFSSYASNNSFNKYQIFLTNLSENESYSTFDLRSAGDVEYDYVVDPFTDNSSLVQYVYDCGDLLTANAVYTLNQSVNTTGTCFNILANNVTLDCRG